MADDRKDSYSHKWVILIAVGMGIFLGTIDISIVNVALPTIVKELNTNFATVQWVILGYLLTISTLMLTVGRLADIKGKKTIYLPGFVLFTLGSLLCGLSPGIHWLIGARVFQALGAVMTISLGIGIITDAFPAEERGKALGIAGGLVSIGIVVGPTLGGLILSRLTWHWIFFVNLPIGIIGTYLVWRFIPYNEPSDDKGFDLLGAAAMGFALLSLLLALTLGQSRGFTDPLVLGLFATSGVLLVGFVILEQHVPTPMIDLHIFRNRDLSLGLATGLLTFVAGAGALLLVPFYLENVLGYNVGSVGLLMAVVPISAGIFAPLSGWLSDRIGPRPITVVGLAVMLIGYIGASTLTVDTGTLGYILRMAPLGVGLGIFQSPNNSAIMGSATRQRTGITSSMLSLSRTVGQTTGNAVLGAIWAGRVLSRLNSIPKGGASAAPPAAQVAGLHETFLIAAGLILVALALAVRRWLQPGEE